MTNWLFYGICEAAFFINGIIYMCTMERRENFWRRFAACFAAGVLVCSAVTPFLPETLPLSLRINSRVLGLAAIILVQHICWKISWSVAVYQSSWALMSWQLLFELWLVLCGEGSHLWIMTVGGGLVSLILIFLIGHLTAIIPVARWMPAGIPKSIGPRQFISAILIVGTFEIISFAPGTVAFEPGNWQVSYLSQLLLAIILYLQNELFKKSAMRQELEVMNLLWQKEQEQYRISKENIALINQKCHDLKHQIRAIRSASKEDIDGYLAEMEDSIRIYEAIVKTGNEVLDTILTEKSLYCEKKGIVVSCVADGSQMGFIHTVDLYAILGNALDNAIEAVEKFKTQEKRQIDVLIYRQQNFLVMNVINPIKGNLVYEEDLPVSTKGDSRFHGFGLRSIKYVVKKYDGYVSVSEEDGCFSLKILIPIPADS